MTPNINSPTANELTTKSIVELSCIVYQNALAVKEMIDALDVETLNGIVTRAELAAATAEADASTANESATAAGIAADTAGASADDARAYADAAAAVLDDASDVLAAKLDKVTTEAARARVYAISRSGNQYLHSISGSTEHHNGALPIYTNVGTLRSAPPQMYDDLATKQYVDSVAGGGGGGLDVANYEGSGERTIPDGRGALVIVTPYAGGETSVALFALPPVGNSPVTTISTTTSGVTLSAYVSSDNWVLSVDGETWQTIVYI